MADSNKLLDSLLDQGVREKRSFGRRKLLEPEAAPANSSAQVRGDDDNEKLVAAVARPGLHGSADTELASGTIAYSDQQKRLLVRSMISAAKADGAFDQKERAEILHRFENLDSDDISFVKKDF